MLLIMLTVPEYLLYLLYLLLLHTTTSDTLENDTAPQNSEKNTQWN